MRIEDTGSGEFEDDAYEDQNYDGLPDEDLDYDGLPDDPGYYSGGDDIDCDEFYDQQEAQDYYEGDPNDPNGLDADYDGIACEHLP